MLPSARRDPRAIRPLETMFDDEVADDILAAHVLVLPLNSNLETAPFPVPSQSGPPDVVEGEEEGSGAASSSQQVTKSKPKLEDWRRRRSV